MRLGIAQIASLDEGPFFRYNFEFDFTRITLTSAIGNGHSHHDALIVGATNQGLNRRVGCKNNQFAIFVQRDASRCFKTVLTYNTYSRILTHLARH